MTVGTILRGSLTLDCLRYEVHSLVIEAIVLLYVS